jgi:hypothetical protein
MVQWRKYCGGNSQGFGEDLMWMFGQVGETHQDIPISVLAKKSMLNI